MKKLLSILAAVGLVTTTGISVVACAPNNKKTDETDDENGMGIKLQVDSSTINIDETLDIKIENYAQIKETLGDFTLRTNEKGTEDQLTLELVGGFDKEKGKFVVKGLRQGTVKVNVQAYYQDENLGQQSITSSLTINVISAEAQQIGFTSDKSELDASSEENIKATIKIDGYEKIKGEWKDFILIVTTLESAVKNEEVLLYNSPFDEEKGEFEVWMGTPGKAKVSVFATPINQAKNQNFANQPNTFTTTEITITVKKYDIQWIIEEDWKWSNSFGYGLTGAEFIKSLDERNHFSLKSDRDYVISNLDLEKKLEKDSEIEFKAKESSKLVTGSGKLKLVNLDIWVLKEKIKDVEIGLSKQEFQKKVEKEMESISQDAIFGTDYGISHPPLVVGEKVRIQTSTSSKILAGEINIPVVGESYRSWDLNKLNDKASLFVETTKKIIEQNKDSGYPEPIKNPKLKDEWAKNYLEMHSFFTRVFLETKYAVVMNLDDETSEIKEVNGIADYNQAEAELMKKLDDSNQVGDNDEYASTLQEYWNKLNNNNKL